MANDKNNEYEEHVEGHISGDVEDSPESKDPNGTSTNNDQPSASSDDPSNTNTDQPSNHNSSNSNNESDTSDNESNVSDDDLNDRSSEDETNLDNNNQNELNDDSDKESSDDDMAEESNNDDMTEESNNDNLNEETNDISENDNLPDESSDLNSDDLDPNQSTDDSEALANDLPHHHANPDEDASKGEDATESTNPDEDASKGEDATENTNPDEDASKGEDATDDTNPDEDASKGEDASESTNPDEDADQDNEEDFDPNELNNNQPNQNGSDNDDSAAEKGLEKGAEAVGYGEEAKAAKTAMSLADAIKNSKGNAKEKVANAAKEAGIAATKGFIKTTVVAYAWPIILAIAAILLILFVMIGTMFIFEDGEDESKGGCSAGDKAAASASVTSSKDADKNAEEIYKYLMSHVKGAKSKATAAHIGNMYIESARTFDPSTVQGGSKFNRSQAMSNIGGYAMGIAQWDAERRPKMIKYVEEHSKSKKWDDLGGQLDYMLKGDGSDSDLVQKLLKDDGSVEDLTAKFMNEWERAGDKSSLGERQAAAKKYYAKFADIDTGGESNISDSASAGADNSDACGDAGGKTDGKMGASVKPNGKSGKILKVWNSKKEIPEKYKKVITLPDFSEKALDALPNNVFKSSGNRGQCTELTWGYMSQLWSGSQPTAGSGGGGEVDGNGMVIYKAYKEKGAKTTKNPTVGYGFSAGPPMEVGGTIPTVGHTGVVVGVLEDGSYIIANYNLKGEANRDHYTRSLTYALIDGQPKSGNQATFFGGVGNKPKIKTEK